MRTKSATASHEDDGPKFVLCLTSCKGVEYTRPKYWTGGMLERWPELSANKDRAHQFSSKQAANEVRSGLADRGFFGHVESA